MAGVVGQKKDTRSEGMKHNFKFSRHLLSGALAGMLVVGSLSVPVQAAGTVPDEIMLGVFFNSEKDTSDTLYWSKDGVNFYELCQAYTDVTPDSDKESWIDNPIGDWKVGTLHDPSIIYKDGWFYMLSGYSTGAKDKDSLVLDESKTNQVYRAMVGYSRDLEYWSFPNAGKLSDGKTADIPLSRKPAGSEKYGAYWDSVAPDFMVDDDGTVYIVASFGYYASWHGDDPMNDIMQPYLIKGTFNVPKGADPSVEAKRNEACDAVWENAVPINLPCMTGDRAAVADDHIDGSLYKEDGWYYFSVKENGVTNEIWRIRDLDRVSDAGAWEEVSDDVITGYEGPCLTKYAGQYFMYVDRLESYTPVDTDKPYGSTGTWVVKASTATTGALDQYTGWLEKNIRPIHTWGADGAEKPNRHGTVITLTGEAAQKVYSLAQKTRYAGRLSTESYKDSDWEHKGWYKKESYRYPLLGGKVVNFWYEDDVRQGVSLGNPDYRGKEIFDHDSDGWYWLDAIYDGKMAAAENVYDPAGNMILDAYKNGDYEVAQPVDQAYYNEVGSAVYGISDSTWKWVRYDWLGKMVKCNDSDRRFYQSGKTGNWYRYDPITGAMVKGMWQYVNDDGYKVTVYFDPTTGVRVDNRTIEINGYSYTFDAYGSLVEGVSGPISALPVIEYVSPRR